MKKRVSNRGGKPPLRVFTTTLWEYPSQHYDSYLIDGEVRAYGTGESGENRSETGTGMQGDQAYAGATPSWIIWQLLTRYTRKNDLVVDPMVGSGTTLDVARDLGRRCVGYDLNPTRDDINQADARKLPLEDGTADFLFIDPPYSTHIDYSDDPRCIGKLAAAGEDEGHAYYEAMGQVIEEIDRVLKNRRYMALYVSDSWKKRKGKPGGTFMPIGFELFSMMSRRFRPIDIVCVARQNTKLSRGNWHKAAENENFFLRGFNYLFIMKKEDD